MIGTFAFRCGCGYVATTENGLPMDHEPEAGSCCNCGGRGCMDCVLRYVHDRCEWSCPDCEAQS